MVVGQINGVFLSENVWAFHQDKKRGCQADKDIIFDEMTARIRKGFHCSTRMVFSVRWAEG